MTWVRYSSLSQKKDNPQALGLANNIKNTMPYYSFSREVIKTVVEAGYVEAEDREAAEEKVQYGEGTVEYEQEIEQVSCRDYEVEDSE